MVVGFWECQGEGGRSEENREESRGGENLEGESRAEENLGDSHSEERWKEMPSCGSEDRSPLLFMPMLVNDADSMAQGSHLVVLRCRLIYL